MLARPEPKTRGCCCCIPLRAGVMILSFLYFLGGIGAAMVAFKVLIGVSYELTTATKAIVIALAALGIFLALASAIGIFATITQQPRAARIYSILFYVWFFLELGLDIAVVVMFFTKSLDSLVVECDSITGRRGGIGRANARRNCESARSKMSWYYIGSMIGRSVIGLYFARRVASFSRHCAERAADLLNPMSTPIASKSAQPVGTMFASNFASQPLHPAPHSSAPVQTPNALGAYPQEYQASADSTQTGGRVEEAPAYCNNATRAV